MQFKNSKHQFGIINMILHWIMALIIIGLYLLGSYMVGLDYYDSLYHKAPWWHKSIGLTLFLLLVIRILWRLSNTSPIPLSQNKIEIKISKIVHLLLYLLLIISCVSGYLISTAEEAGVSFYDWFEIPAYFANGAKQADLAGEIHEYSTLALMILAGLHMLAAFKHHFFNKNKTLIRMLTTK